MRHWSILAGAAALAALAAPSTADEKLKIKDLAVKGKIEGENITFTVDFTIEARKRRPEIALVSGDLVLNSVPSRRSGRTFRYVPGSQTYYMAWKKSGTHTEQVSFACRPAVVDRSEWREATFTIPASNCRKLELVCDRTDLEVRFPGAMKLERKKEGEVLTVTALLGPGRPFAVRWKPKVEKLEAKLVMSADGNVIARAGTGALRLDSLFLFNISQGSLKTLAFSVPKALSVTQVRGAIIQDWHIDDEADAQKLSVTLTRPETGYYALQIASEMVLRGFPVEIDLPAIEPEGVIRASGFLAVGTDSALKLVVDEPRGLSQIDASAFPRRALEDARGRALPRSNTFFYNYATSPYQMKLSIDDIVPSYDATERLVVSVKDDDLVIDADVELDVRDAPVRSLTVEMDPGLIVAKVEGVQVADYSVKEPEAEGARQLVEVHFKKPVIGRTLVKMRIELGESPLGKKRKLGAISVQGAKSERGYIAVAAEQGVEFDSPEATGLREVHTGSVPMRVPGAKKAYRFREGKWALEFVATKRAASISAEAFHLVSIGEGIAYGSVQVTYSISGAPVDEFVFEVPAELRNVEFISRDVRRWENDGTRWKVQLQRKIVGTYWLLVKYNQHYADRKEILVGGVDVQGAGSRRGFICVASHLNLDLTHDDPKERGLIGIEREEVPLGYRRPVNAPILRSFKYVSAPHSLNVALSPYDRGELVPAVVEVTELTTGINIDNEDMVQSRTTVVYEVKNCREQFLALAKPPKVKIWSVHEIERNGSGQERERRISASEKKDLLMVALARKPDPNEPATIRVEYGRSHGKLGWGNKLKLVAPRCATRSTFTRWTVRAPYERVELAAGRRHGERYEYRPKWAIYSAGGTMPADEREIEKRTGLAGVLSQAGRDWKRALRGLTSSVLAVAIALAAVAALIAVFVVRRSSFLASAAAVALLAAVAVGAAARYGASGTEGDPDIELSIVSFSQALKLDSALPEAVVRVVPLWRRQATFLGAVVTPLAALACLVGAVVIRRRRRLLVAVGVSGLVYAAAQLPVFWPAMAHLFTWGVPALVALGCLVLFVGPKVRKGSSSAAAAAVLVAAMLFLPGRAEAAGAGSVDGDGIKEVNRAAYTLKANEDHMEVAVSLVLDVEKALSVPVMPGSAALLTEVTKKMRYRVEQANGAYLVKVKKRGRYEIDLGFLVPLGPAGREGLRAFRLSMPRALTNSVTLEIPKADLEVESPTAVRLTVDRESEKATIAHAVFGPSDECIFIWKPRERKTKLEKAVFFAEVTSLVRFDPGLAEGRNRVRFQIAQGELKVIRVGVPAGMTVTSVKGAELGTWRFDPTDNILEVRLARAASGQYELLVVTQATAESLPYTTSFETLKVLEAKRQRGSVGLATTPAVFVKTRDHPAPMNVDDFVRDAPDLMSAAGVTSSDVRSAYRYHRLDETLTVEAHEVKPELRAREEARFSVGDDKLVYNGQLAVEVSKAGVFSTTLAIPESYDIDSLTAQDLSHWDDTIADGKRLVQVHFNKKLLGGVELRLTTSRAISEYPERIEVPRVEVRGAIKHTGVIQVKSERGVRLSVAERKGVSELDPLELALRGQGWLVFKLLRPDWSLSLKTEVVRARVEVRFLHEAKVSEGLVRHTDHFRYGLHNAGSKRFTIRAPAGAVSFELNGLDFADVDEVEPGLWRVELANKRFDSYRLTARYETHYDRAKGELVLLPARAVGADIQNGHMAVYATRKVEIAPVTEKLASELQPADARSVGREFGVSGVSDAAYCYASSSADYELPLTAVRHDTAELLQARVVGIRVATVVTERGESISRVQMTLSVAGQQYLEARLPIGSDIWSLTVMNQTRLPSTKTGDKGETVHLLPVGQATTDELRLTVDMVYVSPAPEGWGGSRWKLKGPRFDLPLNDMVWVLFLPKGFDYDDFEGSLSVDESTVKDVKILTFTRDKYEQQLQKRLARERAWSAEYVNRGKDFARKGRQKVAKQYFENALSLSRGMNEDARVQLQGMNRKQVMVGLIGQGNKLQTNIGAAAKPQVQQGELGEEFSQEDAQRLISTLSAEQNKNIEHIADNLWDQQEKAVGTTSFLQVDPPLDGRLISLSGVIQVEPNAEMAVSFKTRRKKPSRDWSSPLCAGGLAGVLLAAMYVARLAGARLALAGGKSPA